MRGNRVREELEDKESKDMRREETLAGNSGMSCKRDLLTGGN